MSGIVGSKFNIRGSGLVASYGTDGQHMLSAGAGVSNVFETVAAGADYVKLQSGTVASTSSTVVIGETYFTSTYENYFIYLTNWTVSTAANIYVRFNQSGTAITSSQYEGFILQGGRNSSNTWSETPGDYNQSYARMCGDPVYYDNTMGMNSQIWLPQMNQTSPAVNPSFIASGRSGGIDGDTMRVFFSGYTLDDSTAAVSGITFYTSTGTVDAGEWVLYGLKS